MRLIRSASMWYHATSTSNCNVISQHESCWCQMEARYSTISHNRTADQPHEFLGCNDFFFGQVAHRFTQNIEREQLYTEIETTTLAKKIETAARTWHRRVIYQACTRLCLACVPVSIFLARVVACCRSQALMSLNNFLFLFGPGTPGRVNHMIQSGDLHTGYVRTFVLDEVDIMLSEGFKGQVQDVFTSLRTRATVQVLMFSATLCQESMEVRFLLVHS